MTRAGHGATPRAALRRSIVIAVALAVALAGTASAGTPTEDLKRQTDRVLEILRSPDMTRADRRAAVREIAIASFDVGETARRALGTHWQGRTPEEREEFVRVFRDFLEQTYVPWIDEYGGERLEYVGERVDGDSAVVQARLVTRSGLAVPVESRVTRRGDRWLVYDVRIEAVSLVGNYRSQFERIIRSSSYEELVRRLKARVAQGNDKAAASPSAPRPR